MKVCRWFVARKSWFPSTHELPVVSILYCCWSSWIGYFIVDHTAMLMKGGLKTKMWRIIPSRMWSKMKSRQAIYIKSEHIFTRIHLEVSYKDAVTGHKYIHYQPYCIVKKSHKRRSERQRRFWLIRKKHRGLHLAGTFSWDSPDWKLWKRGIPTAWSVNSAGRYVTALFYISAQ